MPTRGASLNVLTETSRARSEADDPLLTLRRISVVLALCVGLIVCWRAAEVRPAALFDTGALASVWAFVRGLFPPDFSPGFLRVVLNATAQTIQIGLAGTVLSLLIGLPLGILATATLWRRGILLAGEPRSASAFLLASASRITRAGLGLLRAVPDLVWGLLFVVAVGLGPLAGTLALAISYGGVLGRVYADVFEDVNPGPLEALRATGATRGQIFLRAIWPQAQSNIIAYTLYSFECCVRAATVLGFVGAGGIGYEINLSMRLFEYEQVATLIIAFVALLTLADALSRYLRRRLHANTEPRKLRRALWQWATSTPPTQSNSRPLGWLSRSLIIFLALAAIIFSFQSSGFASTALLDANILSRTARFLGALFPPDFDPAFLHSLVRPLLQTFGISVMGTLIGIFIGLALALPSTATLVLFAADAAGRQSWAGRVARWLVYGSARLILGGLRSIPELVWVLICILAVGLGPFAGTLAIGLHTSGVLGKLYADTLEEVPVRPLEALRSSGAGPVQVLLWGMWPQARPTIISYTMLRWEMNLRVSTVLGLVGGGGLGQAIYNNVQLGFYPRVATLILMIYVLVIMTDWLGDRLRARPLRNNIQFGVFN